LQLDAIDQIVIFPMQGAKNGLNSMKLGYFGVKSKFSWRRRQNAA
jgi:hypothetical protein